jgi:hypothetical protein
MAVRKYLGSLAVLSVVACAGSSEPQDASGAAVEVRADNLWAGLPSVTIERFPSDPCDNGISRLDKDPVSYDDWARQRASARNVCFEVWKPGATDMENPDFWRQLDVEVHYRFVGETGDFKMAYVNALDRRGNNRRYVWDIGLGLDPFYIEPNIGLINIPFKIESEDATSLSISSTLEFYFTVNGNKLDASDNNPFKVKYFGGTFKPSLNVHDGGHVLDAEVTCDGGAAKFGGGAGYFAADFKDPGAISAIGAGLDGSLIYGAGVSVSGTGDSKILSILMGSSTFVVPGETLPGYGDVIGGVEPGVKATPHGTSMELTLHVYDRAAKATRAITQTFNNCAKTH